MRSVRDCETLIKNNFVGQKVNLMDNLVGAAKNLYMSLLGAKWLFDVKYLMDRTTGTKELAQLLLLYNRAKELSIDLSKSHRLQEEYILTEDGTDAVKNLDTIVLKEFERLGKIAGDFDELFGTH